MIVPASTAQREPPPLVYAAAAVSVALGLLFIFVRAPHPWGWEGFDHYHEIALDLARGGPFPTLEVPWGYAYSLAAFYRLFGDHPAIPLVAQVALNATVPLLVYHVARLWQERPTATLAAVLTGVFSFNTVYASTQSSDAVCTCLFMTAVVCFAIARRRESARWFAVVGLLAGIVPQFRPNLILIPLLFAAFAVWERRSRRRAALAALLLTCSAAAVLPWAVRNYRLTRMVLPTSVHGGVQLWYGTLQVGPYLHSRAYNPRALFDAPAFDYTSLQDTPIIVEGRVNCGEASLRHISLRYWLDGDATERALEPIRADAGLYTFNLPAPHRAAVIYYYFLTSWSAASVDIVRTTPPAGARAPQVYFVSDNHLGDLDVLGDLLDVFDVARLMRRLAWGEPLPFADRLQAAGISGPSDAVAALMRPLLGNDAQHVVVGIDISPGAVRMVFSDGSSMTVPRGWRNRITDVAFTRGIASTLMSSRIPLRALAATPRLSGIDACTQVGDIAVDQVFYRREPQMMRRYTALSWDNIRRSPVEFALASAYRMVRLFVIEGTTDPLTAQQFTQSRRVYGVASAMSIVFLALFFVGLVAGGNRGPDALLALLLIAYIPATLAPVLTNMRYTVTVQPLMFIFTAAGLRAIGRYRRGTAGSAAATSQTAR